MDNFRPLTPILLPPRFIGRLQAVAVATLLAVALPQAPAQTFKPMSDPLKGVDPSSVVGKMTGEKGKEQGPPQQPWRFAKGKAHDRLPPDFQWDTPPTPVNTPYPVYPYELLRTGVAGKIRAYFIIGPMGRVVKVELDEAATPEFGLAVRAMLDSCRFNPARKKDGAPAYANVGIEYDFETKGRSDAPVAPEGRLILRDLEKKPENIIGFQELDEPLKPLSRQPPTYPIALLKTMPAGDAVVEFFVDVNGNVQLPHIKSSSAPEFGYAAVQAVAAWRFEVPKKGGKVVVVRAEVPVGFEGRKADGAQKP
jgi:TonB family protein